MFEAPIVFTEPGKDDVDDIAFMCYSKDMSKQGRSHQKLSGQVVLKKLIVFID